MEQYGKPRAYYSYDDDAVAISTLMVHENKKNGILLINFINVVSSLKVGPERIQTSK